MGKAVGFGVDQSASNTAGSNLSLIYLLNSHSPEFKTLVADTYGFEVNINAIINDRLILQPSRFPAARRPNQTHRAGSCNIREKSEGFTGNCC